MTSSSNSKNSDTDKPIQWLESGITEGYINYHDYNEFKNIKYIDFGASCNVYKATWESSNTVVALKSFFNNNNDLLMKEIVNEVYNILISTYYFAIILLKYTVKTVILI